MSSVRLEDQIACIDKVIKGRNASLACLEKSNHLAIEIMRSISILKSIRESVVEAHAYADMVRDYGKRIGMAPWQIDLQMTAGQDAIYTLLSAAAWPKPSRK